MTAVNFSRSTANTNLVRVGRRDRGRSLGRGQRRHCRCLVQSPYRSRHSGRADCSIL